MESEFDFRVEDTSQEAMASKISAINKGYFSDKYAKCFFSNQSKKDVLMNRGYWSRYEAFRMMIYKFLNSQKSLKKNIISLGCGFDTLYFNLADYEETNNLDFNLVEVDLESVVKSKIQKIKYKKELSNIFNQSEIKSKLIKCRKLRFYIGDCIISKKYKLICCDLRNMKQFMEKMKELEIDQSIPTLVFSECVLAYIETKFTDQIFQTILTNFKNIYFLDYEMFNGNDSFGKMMIKNFDTKGCPLHGIQDFPTIESIKNRFEKFGFTKIVIENMLKIYNEYLSKAEKSRIEKIEWFDEFEEWNIMQSHYFFAFLGRETDVNIPEMKLVKS